MDIRNRCQHLLSNFDKFILVYIKDIFVAKAFKRLLSGVAVEVNWVKDIKYPYVWRGTPYNENSCKKPGMILLL